MHDQRSHPPADEPGTTEHAILTMLLAEGPRLWSTEEVAREIDDPQTANDAIESLHGAGLVHRLDGFVFATRAATHAAQIAQA